MKLGLMTSSDAIGQSMRRGRPSDLWRGRLSEIPLALRSSPPSFVSGARRFLLAPMADRTPHQPGALTQPQLDVALRPTRVERAHRP